MILTDVHVVSDCTDVSSRCLAQATQIACAVVSIVCPDIRLAFSGLLSFDIKTASIYHVMSGAH